MLKRLVLKIILIVIIIGFTIVGTYQIYSKFIKQDKNEEFTYKEVKFINDQYISKYGTISLSDWENYHDLSDKYQSPDAFLYDIDYYFDVIARFIGHSDTWMDHYQEDNLHIRFAVHETNAYFYLPDLTIYMDKVRIERDIPAIAHEITHVITPESGSISLQEGLACYMQDLFGNKTSLGGKLTHPIHPLSVEYLDKQTILDKVLPLIGSSSSYGHLEDREEVYAFYRLSYSFCKYLIDTYGIEKFMTVLETDAITLLDTYVDTYNQN